MVLWGFFYNSAGAILTETLHRLHEASGQSEGEMRHGSWKAPRSWESRAERAEGSHPPSLWRGAAAASRSQDRALLPALPRHPCGVVCTDQGTVLSARSGLPEAGKHTVHLLLFADVYSKSLFLLAQSRDCTYPPDTDLGTTHSCICNSYIAHIHIFINTEIPSASSQVLTLTHKHLKVKCCAVSNPDMTGRGVARG